VGSASPLIAVVDDETAVGTMLRRALRLAGYEVATFASGQEFLDSLPTCPPTCVILDIHMPGLSGFEWKCACARRTSGCRSC
jgi:FixJ family two-component response regulator